MVGGRGTVEWMLGSEAEVVQPQNYKRWVQVVRIIDVYYSINIRTQTQYVYSCMVASTISQFSRQEDCLCTEQQTERCRRAVSYHADRDTQSGRCHYVCECYQCGLRATLTVTASSTGLCPACRCWCIKRRCATLSRMYNNIPLTVKLFRWRLGI